MLAFAAVGRPKLTYTIKAVRTEGELLNGSSCSAIDGQIMVNLEP
jgi:hypothetical protein